MSTSLKTLVTKLDDTCRAAAERAAAITMARGHHEVDIEHVLLALLEVADSDVGVLCRRFDVSASGLTPETHVDDYRLELNLDTAVARTNFRHAGTTYTREIFVSAPDQVIVMRLTAEGSATLSFTARLDRPAHFDTASAGTDRLTLSGEAIPVHDNPGLPVKENPVGIRFYSELLATAEGGTIKSEAGVLTVSNAHTATLFIDYMLRPEVIARASNALHYANANAAAKPLVKAELLNDPNVYPPPEVFERLYVVTPKDQDLQRELNRQWTRVQTGQ